MRAEHEVNDMLKRVSRAKMLSESKREEIWAKIQYQDKAIKEGKFSREKPILLRRVRISAIAAVSVLVLVVGGTLLSDFVKQHSSTSNEGSGQVNTNYSILKGISPPQRKALKDAVKKSGIKNLQMPTKLPFPVTKVWTTGLVPGQHHIEIVLQGGSPIHYYDIDATQVSKSLDGKNPFKSNIGIVMAHKQETSLKNGTSAEFGYNQSVSKLAWVEQGVLYVVHSGKRGSFPGKVRDLNKQQLIDVAASFK